MKTATFAIIQILRFLNFESEFTTRRSGGASMTRQAKIREKVPMQVGSYYTGCWRDGIGTAHFIGQQPGKKWREDETQLNKEAAGLVQCTLDKKSLNLLSFHS